MREIKFRGKQVDNGEWVYGQYASRKDGREHYIIEDLAHIDSWEWNADAEYVIPETVGQFTGLLDKNGTRIFEGDLTLALWTPYQMTPPYKVEMFNGSFVIVNDTGIQRLFDLRGVDYEVIGNIHEE